MSKTKSATVTPLGDRVLVKRVEADEKTKGGIILPDTAKEKPREGIVVAVGNAPNPMLSSTPGLRMSRWGTIITDPETGMTDKPDVFAGGDIVTGGATVILAMGAGRRAAQSIDGYLRTGVVAAGSPD